jgi:hypothetical protein
MALELYKLTYFGKQGRVNPLVHIMVAAGLIGYSLHFEHLLRESPAIFGVVDVPSTCTHVPPDEHKKNPPKWSQYYVESKTGGAAHH